MLSLFKKALKSIWNSELIILPTDTVYGLVCRYDSKFAIEKIYKLKKRERNKPLILLGYNWQTLKKFVNVGTLHTTSLRKFIKEWPGPLTLVLPGSKYAPKFLNKGFKTIGVRIPNNKFLLRLLKHCPEQILASTSANISGKSNRKPQNELLKKVKLFVKAKKGEMSFQPSRIIEITKQKFKVLR